MVAEKRCHFMGGGGGQHLYKAAREEAAFREVVERTTVKAVGEEAASREAVERTTSKAA